MKKLKVWLTKIKEILFYKSGKPLTGAAMILMWFYLLSLFYLIGYGVFLQTSSAMESDIPIGFECLKLAEQEKRIVEKKERGWDFVDFYDVAPSSFGASEVCQELYRRFIAVYNDPEFQRLHRREKTIDHEIDRVRMKIKRIEKEYGNMLLERIANQPSDRSILSTSALKAKADLQRLKNQLANLQRQSVEVYRRFFSLPTFVQFEEFLKKNYQAILDRYQRELQYRYFKIFGYAYLFLLPIFGLFWLFFRYGKRSGNDILMRLAAAGALVTAIYMALYLLWLIYEVIPFTYFRRLVEWLAKFDLEVLFSVVGVLVIVPLFWWLISIAQRIKPKPVPKSPKIHFLRNGRCGFCGAVVVKDGRYCGVCGESIKARCSGCDREHLRGLSFCPYCGKRSENEAR